MKVRDYFAEMFVAGRLADADWNVYFPRRDRGFDFIITKPGTNGSQILRPVQVKGKYPTAEKRDCAGYGYVGDLSQLHPDMVLAIPFFRPNSKDTPSCIAYLPHSLIRARSRGGFRCEPATLTAGAAKPRREFAKFFDDSGMKLLERPDWSTLTIGP